MESRTLVIGDVHGHYDRLVALLQQEGIIDDKERRIVSRLIRVIQVGDLGHFGRDGQPTGDRMCYEKAPEWFDTLCWGNHDAALFSSDSMFSGYVKPDQETFEAVQTCRDFMTYAACSHGYLITHAGLHPAYKQKDPVMCKTNVHDWADFINYNLPNDVIFDISHSRGGWEDQGGILWRDAEELLHGVPQIFGHSARDTVRKYPSNEFDYTSYCIDVGQKDNGRLAGIWLPDETVVEVKLDEIHNPSVEFQLEHPDSQDLQNLEKFLLEQTD